MRRFKWVAAFVVTCMMLVAVRGSIGENQSPAEAPTGFDTSTNGLVDQATHDEDRAVLEEVDEDSEGLGPVFNAKSCTTCHLNPTSGGTSQVSELRAGHLDESGNFQNPSVVIDHGTNVITGRSLINQFAICPQAQEKVPDTETIRAVRMSVSTLGDGFVEAIDDHTLLAIAQVQRAQSGGAIKGEAIQVPVLEAPGETRVGRFGWKDQHASLLSFAADAYLNEQGITTRLLPDEITFVCDKVADVEDPTGADGLADIDVFARFIRASKAPPVDAAAASQPDAQAGAVIFDQVGCGACHVRSIKTAPAGTAINGGTFTVPDALGGKLIHPFSDFLLHDVGTGDGIVQNGGSSSANKLRTPPLWGLRVRDKLMHDGESTSYRQAILRHAGEAAGVINRYRGLTDKQKQQLKTFLGSL
jgi:CxxC motif-containing protein (DUF1111 family)